jgi:hypothetical protein
VRANFGPQMRALKDRYRVIRYDARGHARATRRTRRPAYTPATFVDDMGRVLDDAGMTNAVVAALDGRGHRAPLRARASRARARPRAVRVPRRSGRSRGIRGEGVRFAETIERDGLEAAGDVYVWGPSTRLDRNACTFVQQGFLEHPPHGLALSLRGVIAKQPPVRRCATTWRGSRARC